MSYRLRKFDPKSIRQYSTVLFAGGRRTGKSFVMRDFLWHIADCLYDCNIFSGTYDEEHPWTKFSPKQLVHYCLEEFDVASMKAAMSNQEVRKKLAETHRTKCPPTMMLFEDIEHLQPPIWKDQSMRALMLNGRWSKSYCFVAFQYIMEVKMAMRGSFDYAVFAMENSAAVRDRIWKQFGGIFETFKEFEQVFFKCTENYKVMVIDCRSRSYNVEDTVFWYKAKDRGNFKIGHPDVWNRGSEGSSVPRQIPLDRSVRLVSSKKHSDNVRHRVDATSRRNKKAREQSS